MPSKISQTEKDKYHIFLPTCGIWKTNEQIKQKQTTDTENKQPFDDGCQMGLELED